MSSKSTLLKAFFALSTLFSIPASAQITYVDNGSSTTYTLNTGDSLYIASGTYTGTITSFASGAKITVATGATFQPASMAFPNVRGTMYVHGTFKISSFRSNSGFTLHNYGITWVTGTTLMSGSSQVWTNYYGGLMKLDGAVTMTNNNSLTNRGIMNCSSTLDMNGTSSITNKNAINITGNYTNSGGTLTNEGRFQTTGSITFNNGLAIVYNYCRMIADGGINNTSGSIYNYGFMWARASLGLGNFVNSGTFFNGPIARVKSVTFNNTGTVTGSGYLYFTGSTSTTNLGTTGVSTSTTDTIKIYDVSRTSPSTIYDVQSGIVHPNVVYRVFTAPDSTNAYLPGCAVEISSEIPLGVKWNYFYVNMSENIPALNWSAQYDAGTVFEVQRSYDGADFTTLDNVASQNGKTGYNYNDQHVNTIYGIAYYRIKAIEPTGAVKFSETRSVKFGNKPGLTIQATPNPFTSQFTLHYQTTEKGIITIRVFSLNGQLRVTKNAAVSNGYNSITIAEAASLAKGMYMVQISKGSQLISAEKIIKQ